MTHDAQSVEARRTSGKPFPWGCANCRADEVYPATMPYTIDVKHDGRSYRISIPEFDVPRCRACGTLVFGDREDDRIIEALRSQARLLTPPQILAGRQALGLSSGAFAERLGVAEEIISRWETGALIQSRAMDNLLRLYFALPEVRNALSGPDQRADLGIAVLPAG